MIFIVLGMHKSGTTLLARALHESGIVMGEEFPAGIDYEKAKYEAKWVQEINDSILGVDRKKLSLLVSSSALAPEDISDDIKKKMRESIAGMQARYLNWGFKDPRTVLTYHLWKKVLPDHRLIVVYRDPIEVWRRYSGFNRFSRSHLPFKVWCEYNQRIIKFLYEMQGANSITLNFEYLLSETGEWNRFTDYVGVKIKDVRDPNQSVNRLNSYGHKPLRYRLLEHTLGRKAAIIYQNLNDIRLRKSEENILFN